MTKESLIELYSLDPDFISTYHGFSNMSIEECANDTWETIKNADSYVYDFGYFTIDETLDFIPRLTGFFIKPEYRNLDTFKLFKTELCDKMPAYFMGCTKKDNNKLNNFFNKLGGDLLKLDNLENMNYYIFKRESL